MWEQKEMGSLKDIKEVEKTEFDDGLDSWRKVKDGWGCLTIFLELFCGQIELSPRRRGKYQCDSFVVEEQQKVDHIWKWTFMSLLSILTHKSASDLHNQWNMLFLPMHEAWLWRLRKMKQLDFTF